MARLVVVLFALSLVWAVPAAEAQPGQKVRQAQKTRTKTRPQPQQRVKMTSTMKQHPALAKQASKLEGAQQASADGLVAQLLGGNMNPGTGSKHLFGGVHEARARNGARVYFRTKPGEVEIVGKSTKDNQDRVIDLLRGIFGKPQSSVERRATAKGVLQLAELATEARIDADDPVEPALRHGEALRGVRHGAADRLVEIDQVTDGAQVLLAA